MSRDVQKLMQDYRSSQDIIVTLGLDEPSEEDKMKVAEVITNNPGNLVPAVETTAIARKPCLYKEDGCNWQVPKHDQISITTDEAELYVRSHSTGCIYNPVVVQETRHRWEQ